MVKIDDFHEAFTKAEEEIHFAEMAIGGLSSDEDDACVSKSQPRGVVIPAINELRYAAKHLSKALKAREDESQINEQLQRAIRHCIRSRLDALKAVILFLSRHFFSFTGDYKRLNVPEEDRKILNSHRQRIWDILNSLARHHAEDTDAECEQMREAIEELCKIYVDVEGRRGAYNVLLEKMNRHDKTTLWQCIAGIAFALLLFFITLFFTK